MARTAQRWNARVSTREQAQKSLTTHVFRPSRGYIEFAAHMALKPGAVRHASCVPTDKTKSGAQHYLKPPDGHPPILCAWIPNEQAWQPLNRVGKRMAFTAAYLASWGWTYLKAA